MTSKTNRRLLEAALARVIRRGVIFTADDITDNGLLTLDGGAHKPNARQNGIGAFFQAMAKEGYIEFTGDVITSKAPKRKGGMIRVWTATEKGRAWAAQQ